MTNATRDVSFWMFVMLTAFCSTIRVQKKMWNRLRPPPHEPRFFKRNQFREKIGTRFGVKINQLTPRIPRMKSEKEKLKAENGVLKSRKQHETLKKTCQHNCGFDAKPSHVICGINHAIVRQTQVCLTLR